MFAYGVVNSLIQGEWFMAFIPILAIFNYFLFFWEEIAHFLTLGKHRVKHSGGRKPINLQQAQKELKQQKGYLHKCTVCGITDVTNPDMDFRYCSQCEGYYCYCMDHINNHEHVK